MHLFHKYNGISFLIILVVIGLCFTQCGYHKASFQGKEFERLSALENSGFTKQKLDNLDVFLKKNMETSGMVILYDGKIIYEYGDIEEISYIASCRKSVLSILYGRHVENDKIDLEQTIDEIGIDEKDGLLPQEKLARVDDIITSRSGVFHIPANGGYDEKNILKRGSVRPGEYFVYNNWDFNVGGYILEKQTGNSIYQELENQLAIPLGFQDWNIKNQKKKHSKKKSRYPAYHMYLSTRDMAKIGQLMLNNGYWEGKQIVSSDWIKKITTVVTPVDTVNSRYGLTSSSHFQLSYSYMWWMFEQIKNEPDFDGGYTASGYGGQYITVIPRRKLVIAHKTKLKTLVRWGIKSGGVSESSYWNLLYRIVTGKRELSELLDEGKSIEDLVDAMKNSYNLDVDKSESGINKFGYHLFQKKQYKDALKVFRLNTELYPSGFNTYDSLGECLLKMDKKQEAIEAYRKSLKLNPKNLNALKILEKYKLSD